MTPSTFSCTFLPCPPAQHTHKGSLIFSALNSKACTWPCTQSWTWLLRAMTLITGLLFPSSLLYPTLLLLGKAFVPHLLFKKIDCSLPPLKCLLGSFRGLHANKAPGGLTWFPRALQRGNTLLGHSLQITFSELNPLWVLEKLLDLHKSSQLITG